MIEIKKLSKKYKNSVGRISAECFADDVYFDYLSQNKEEKKEKLYSTYKGAFDIALKFGDCFGAFVDGVLVGYVMVIDFQSLKADKQVFAEVFDVSESEFSDEVYKFLDYADRAENTKYILAICVEPNYQRQGIGFSLIQHISKQYSGCRLISDVDNKNSLSIYRKLGFDVIPAGEKIFIVDKLAEEAVVEK